MLLLSGGYGIWEPLQFQETEMSPGLFQGFMDGYIKPSDSPH